MLMADKIVVYGGDFCAMAPPVRSLLQRAGVDYDYISISRNRAARQRVMDINQGKASVPTLVFPDGSTLTEPTLLVLTARLQALGHTVAPETFWQGLVLTLESPRILLFGLIFLALGITFEAPALTFAGAVLLPLALLGRLAGAISRR